MNGENEWAVKSDTPQPGMQSIFIASCADRHRTESFARGTHSMDLSRLEVPDSSRLVRWLASAWSPSQNNRSRKGVN